jgi:hypothetical protein
MHQRRTGFFMNYWAMLLHIYQPPFQSYEILKKVDDESYSKLFDVFLRFPSSKLTLNINGILTELLSNYKMSETIEKIKKLAENGQLRFTGSGKYHPLFPLIPLSEMRRQIHLNEEYNRQILGPKYSDPKGFFPPELAISRSLLELLKEMQYKWALATGVACPAKWPIHWYYTYKGLPIFFRDTVISDQISFKQIKPLDFVTKIQTLFSDDHYVITASDGETYGHHIKNYEEDFLATVLAKLESTEDVKMIFLDEIPDLFESQGEVIPINSSWSTSANDLTAKNPYPLWADLKNEIHTIQGVLQEKALRLFQILDRNASKIPEDQLEFYKNARVNLDKGEQSCRLWWASTYNYNEDLIIRGVQFLVTSTVNAYRALFSIPLKRKEQKEVQNLQKDFRTEYSDLLQALAKETENRSRYKPSKYQVPIE